MFQCNICQKEFRSERSLSGHKSSHNRDNDTYKLGRQKIFIDPNEIKVMQPRKCNFCEKEFENGWQAGGHIVKCELNPNRDKAIDSLMRTVSTYGEHNINGKSRYRKGFYKGFKCDSSWELAYLLYNLDRGNLIERNFSGFNYDHAGKSHRYYPDFIVENEYIEIKGRTYDKDFSKWEQFPNKLTVISGKEIGKYLKYAKDTYGEDFHKVYDSNNKNKSVFLAETE